MGLWRPDKIAKKTRLERRILERHTCGAPLEANEAIQAGYLATSQRAGGLRVPVARACPTGASAGRGGGAEIL